MAEAYRFAPRGDHEAVEGGLTLMPRFDRDGLIVAIAVDALTNEVLMVAHMNAEALSRTIAGGEAWFFSRSRQSLWRKGESSGNTLRVKELRVDCDQDALLLKVEVAGNGVACHRGYRSCFYRSVPLGQPPATGSLVLDGAMRHVP
ncbi:MAG TPA: phosphoribosyl-AMP cyclohydrolase [Bauldia sp.]|nr:phosphoribosyl-AMP cyclohydrolase [Bauldia sp.]